MKLLLTDSGIKNPSIRNALVDLLGKPIAESSALCIPTADLLPSLHDTVYVGLSAGSMVMTPGIGEDFVDWKPPAGGDKTLGLVDFAIFPHLDHPDIPENSMANAEKWATGMPVPAYAIDGETAIKVTDGAVEVVSEGHWKRFTS